MKYKLNGQWVDVSIKPLDSLPIGTIVQFAGETIPNGWLVCDGSSLSTTTYPDLYTIIGTKYGGSGSSFNLPNFKGRVPVGQDSSQTEFDTLGETGGSKYLQEHDHVVQKYWGVAGNAYGYKDTAPYFNNKSTDWTTGFSSGSVNGVTTGNSGNLQPYLVVNYIIKAFNTIIDISDSGKILLDWSQNSDSQRTLLDSLANYRNVLFLTSETNGDSSGNADALLVPVSSLLNYFCVEDASGSTKALNINPYNLSSGNNIRCYYIKSNGKLRIWSNGLSSTYTKIIGYK